MKKIIILLLSLLFLKVITLTVVHLQMEEKEALEKFIALEYGRKHTELQQAFNGFKIHLWHLESIPKEIRVNLDQGLEQLTLKPNFEHNRLKYISDYLRKNLDSIEHTPVSDPEKFPEKLRELITEEISRTEINNLLKRKKWDYPGADDRITSAIITSIASLEDSLQIDLFPFTYRKNYLILKCVSAQDTFVLASNPFHYAGTIDKLSCIILNPVTKEEDEITF